MIPATYPTFTNPFNGFGDCKISYLSSVSGLVAWTDYIPVRTVVASTSIEGRTEANGYQNVHPVGATGNVAWTDYIPVYEDATKTVPWSTDANGYIPVGLSEDGVLGFLSEADVQLELTHTAVPTAGSIVPTFTRATTETGQRWDESGYLDFTALAGEIVWKGARRVRNIHLSSQTLNDANWSASGASVVADQYVAPDGTTTMDQLKATAGNAAHFVGVAATFTVVANDVYVLSFYAKYVNHQWLTIRFAGTANTLWGAFDLENGAVGASSGATLSIVSLGSGMYRCSMLTTLNLGTAAGTVFAMANANTNTIPTWNAAGTEVLGLWGVQVEDVTGQTTQTASEYVSVGVESAPAYHGSCIDGVRCYSTDRSGNPITTTTTYDSVTLNGVAGTYVSTPDSVAASITGDIDIRVNAALVDWTPAVENWLVGKIAGSGARSYDMYVAATSGLLVLRASIDGSVVPQWNSTVAPTVSDGGVLWIRGCRVASTGAVTFYTSTDGDTWTQLGAVVAGTSGAIFDSTSVLTVGSNISGATPTSGKIYTAQIYNGIGLTDVTPTGTGTLAVDFNASRYAGGTTLTGSTGETWTLNGSAVIHPTNYPLVGYVPWEARTNLCLQSQAQGTAPWNDPISAGADLTATNNIYVAPDGATTMARLVANATSSFHVLRQGSITYTAAAYTYSLYVRYVSHRWLGLMMFDGTTSRYGSFDLLNGVVGSLSAGTTSTITPTAISGVYRISITGTMAATASGIVDIALNNTDATASQNYLATGTAIGAWGAQVELGSFATPYIPTTTVAVARNASVLTYTGADIANIKALACTFSRGVGVTGSGAPAMLSAAGSSSSYAGSYFDNTTATSFRFEGYNGATQWQRITNATAGVTHKAAFSVATNDVKMDLDGTAQTADTSAVVPVTPQLNVGCLNNSFFLNGPVNHIYGWTRNLSQSESNAVTVS